MAVGGRGRERQPPSSDQGVVTCSPRVPDLPGQGKQDGLLAVGIEQPGRAVEQRLRANKIRPLYRSHAWGRCIEADDRQGAMRRVVGAERWDRFLGRSSDHLRVAWGGSSGSWSDITRHAAAREQGNE